MQIQILRSARRHKTISARLQGDTLIVRLPAGLAPAEEQKWVDRMAERATKAHRRAELNGDDQLQRRAQELNRRYFEGKLHWSSLRFVTNQNSRMGSCSPADRSIRLSHRLAEMPDWVLDYVLVHELAHLLQANHSPRFWRLVNRFPLAERARGFLIAKGMEGDEEEGS
jgi:predicted metal-dependent hydrolase